jgi:hypothetical protein
VFDYLAGLQLDTSIVSNLSNIIEFVFLSFFYISVLRNFISKNKLQFCFGIVFLVFLCFPFILNENDPLDFIASTFIGFVFAISAFITIYKENFGGESKLTVSETIFNYGFAFYFVSTLLIYLFSNILIEEIGEGFRYLWLINNGVSIVLNLIFALGLWKTRKQ